MSETAREKRDRLRERLAIEQREFCEVYAETADASLAYEKAYGREDSRAGFRLLDRWYIQEYLEALVDCAGDSLVMGRTECLSILASIARGKEGVNPSDQIKAIAQLSKISGLEKPARHEVTGNHGGPVQIGADGMSREMINAMRDVILGKQEST